MDRDLAALYFYYWFKWNCLIQPIKAIAILEFNLQLNLYRTSFLFFQKLFSPTKKERCF